MYYDHSTSLYYNRSTCIVSDRDHVQRNYGRDVRGTKPHMNAQGFAVAAGSPMVCPENKRSISFRFLFNHKVTSWCFRWISWSGLGWGVGITRFIKGQLRTVTCFAQVSTLQNDHESAARPCLDMCSIPIRHKKTTTHDIKGNLRFANVFVNSPQVDPLLLQNLWVGGKASFLSQALGLGRGVKNAEAKISIMEARGLG